MRFTAIFLSLFCLLPACQQTSSTKTYNIQGDNSQSPGWTSVFQTTTSDTETVINILRPRLAKLVYVVEEYNPSRDFQWQKQKEEKVFQTVKGPHIHWAVDKIHIKNLSPSKIYRLNVVNPWRKKAIDWRIFKTMDLKKKQARFVVGSCMSDSHAFEHVRSKIWDRMISHDPDFIMLLGDQVYVDDFDFVKRQEATEFDLWTRYIDAFRKIPLFNGRRLVPLLTVWDDHDYGTNNSDKNFKSKKAAKKVYEAFFGGVDMPGTYEGSSNGVSFSFNGFGQKFILMDNRYFRDPSKKASFGQWGKAQHKWFEKQVRESKTPIWLANGSQFFTEAMVITRKDGSKKQLNESFVGDHPKHFQTLLKNLKDIPQPTVFLSGDIHYSEIVGLGKELLGYPTYEITSSPIHSYIFRSKKGPETWLNNPRRLVSVKEHNYLLVESTAEKALDIRVQSFGVKQEKSFFEKTLRVAK